MAIYHLSVQTISRSQGRSAMAAAAYRAAARLFNARTQLTHDFSRKRGVVHAEILTPPHAPRWMQDRQKLWQSVEDVERRKDARTAREIQVALPTELDPDKRLTLLRDYVQTQFVDCGMVADIAVHMDNPDNPHGHIMLTTRLIAGSGDAADWGLKEPAWNAKEKLLDWRAEWAQACNHALARDGHDVRVDHRSYIDQDIALEPTPKLNVGRAHGREDGRDCIAERLAAHDAVVRRNGEAIAAEPDIALHGITQQRATFTRADLARYLHTYTADAAQFETCRQGVMASEELVRLPQDVGAPERFTSRAMLTAERDMRDTARRLAAREQTHAVPFATGAQAMLELGEEPRQAAAHVLYSPDIAVIEGYAGAGKSTMLAQARVGWEACGYRVLGAALSGKAAEGLEVSAGLASRSLASWEHSWKRGYNTLAAGDVLVVDEAGMVGTRQMQRVLSAVEAAGAKVVLVGDTQQLQAIEAGAPMRALAQEVGHFAMVNIQRQRDPAQRAASVDLAQGRVAQALDYYAAQGAVQAHADTETATHAMVEAWDAARQNKPDTRAMMLAYRRSDVAMLNAAARARRVAQGELGAAVRFETTRGPRDFAVGERIYFLRNDRSLGVKNGTLAQVTGIDGSVLQVRLDPTGPQDTGREVAFDTLAYPDLDYGYAATVHKAQGVTVDCAFVLASRHFDCHTSYVALTRHRDAVQLHYSREDFAGPQALSAQLSRQQTKDMALDYTESVRRNADLEHSHGTRRVRKADAATTPPVARELDPTPVLAQAASDAHTQASSAEIQSPAKTQTPVHADIDATTERHAAQTQAAAYAACQARVAAHEAELKRVAIERQQLAWQQPDTAETIYRRQPEVKQAEHDYVWSRGALDDAHRAKAGQEHVEAAYREMHPIRTALGLETPREIWQHARETQARALATAVAQHTAAQKARDALGQNEALRARCAEEAKAARVSLQAQRTQAEDRSIRVMANAPAYERDKATLKDMQAERAQRDVRLAQNQRLQRELDAVRGATQTQTQSRFDLPRPATLQQALQHMPEVQSVVAQRDLAISRLELAQAAAQRHQAGREENDFSTLQGRSGDRYLSRDPRTTDKTHDVVMARTSVAEASAKVETMCKDPVLLRRAALVLHAQRIDPSQDRAVALAEKLEQRRAQQERDALSRAAQLSIEKTLHRKGLER